MGGINNNVSPVPFNGTAPAPVGAGAPDATQQTREIGEMLSAFMAAGGVSGVQLVDDDGKVDLGAIPELDSPVVELLVRVNLEVLVAYLKMDTDEEQLKVNEARIAQLKDQIAAEADQRLEQIDESLKEMDKAAKASLFTKIFGWIMAAVAVVVAVASCVVTGGLALGAVVGAVIAVGLQSAQEFGAMDALTEVLVDALKDAGLSDEAAQILSAVIICVAELALSIGGGAAANKIAENVAKNAVKAGVQTVLKTMKDVTDAFAKFGDTAQKAQRVMNILEKATKIAGYAVQGVNAYAQFSSTMSQAELEEVEAILQNLQKALEEAKDNLEEILRLLEEGFSQIADLLGSQNGSQEAIANEMQNIV